VVSQAAQDTVLTEGQFRSEKRMARLPLLLLALSAVARAFVSFHSDYSISYCETSHEKECECYNAGYSYEHVECYVENGQSCASLGEKKNMRNVLAHRRQGLHVLQGSASPVSQQQRSSPPRRSWSSLFP